MTDGTGGERFGVAPLDAFNQYLIDAVHPADWQNPVPPPGRYHLVVIGAGPGGLITAAIAAGLGARVALIERHLMGGDCLTVGCVPSKALIRAARVWSEAAHAASVFGGPRTTGPGDFAAATARMRRVRAELSDVDSARRYMGLGVDVYMGDARFIARDAVKVGDTRFQFRRAVIATGARAATPRVDGLNAVDPLTNETVFNLTERPARLIVIGGGPIGCELAQAFARLGSQVTLLQQAARLLPRDDAAAGALVRQALERDRVTVACGVNVSRAGRQGEDKVVHYRMAGEHLEHEAMGDAVLVATGRVPNVEGLGLDLAGVVFTPRGVRVNDRLRTTNRRIYAVGDIASRYKFTHAADATARLVVQNALFFGRKRVSRLVIPWCTYTSPEVAHVGLTEETARQRRVPIETVTVPLDRVDRTVIDETALGMLAVHLRRGTDRILGATLVAEHAGDMIGEITLAIENDLGLGAVGATIHPYPTQADVFRKAADTWRRQKLTPSAQRILKAFFRLVR